MLPVAEPHATRLIDFFDLATENLCQSMSCFYTSDPSTEKFMIYTSVWAMQATCSLVPRNVHRNHGLRAMKSYKFFRAHHQCMLLYPMNLVCSIIASVHTFSSPPPTRGCSVLLYPQLIMGFFFD